MDEARDTHVYVLRFMDRVVKVGVSINPESRWESIEMESGRKIAKYFVTVPMTRKQAFDVETYVKTKFVRKRVRGNEYFKGVTFEEVVEMVHEARRVTEKHGGVPKKKLITFEASPDLQEQLDYAKWHPDWGYWKSSQAEMIRDLIVRGIEALQATIESSQVAATTESQEE